MNLILFVITIVIAFIAVRIGAIAFQLTGLDWSLAKFQALSCFSGTGFTTKEAELITCVPQRRRIATILMILGNAGFVALIATFANSLNPKVPLLKITIPFIPSALIPWIHLTIIIGFLYVFYKVSTNSKYVKKITNSLRNQIVKKEIIKPVSFEELLIATGGYGVSQIEISVGNPLVNKTLLESNLRKHDVLILVIERKGESICNPPDNTKILPDDLLTCFGKLDFIRKELCVMGDKS